MGICLFTKRIFRKLFQRDVFVFGDSHTEVFENISKEFPFYKYHFNVIKVGGATAQGMRNPNSKTNALATFLAKLNMVKSKKSKIFLMLGEVDTGFVIWYRSQKYNETIEEQLNQSITAYFNFIEQIISRGYRKITIFSAALPTIEDGQTWGEIANARREITATKVQRTQLTLRYNKLLWENCKKLKINFINCDSDLLDQETNLIKSEYKNQDPNNHHLDLEKYTNLIMSKL